MSLSSQQEKVEGILLLLGKIEGSFDYDYESWVVNVPNREFLSSIIPTDLKYWERYTGPDPVKEWRKHLDILLPMLAPIVTLYSIWVTYGEYIVVCCVDSKIIKATVLHDEIVVQEIKSNIVLCTTKIHEFCNEYTPLEADLVLVDGRTWLESRNFHIDQILLRKYYKNPRVLEGPGKFTMVTLAPVPATFCDPYGIQTWCKPFETTIAEEKEKQYSMIGRTDVLTHHPHCRVSQYEFHFLKEEIFGELLQIVESFFIIYVHM
ncbi:hypothetical protein FXO38_27206 [Capsicum annuum]|nr:hypothetical protein FXO38_27206 [Capsicum annuum]